MPFRTRQQELVAQFHRVMRAPAPAQPTPLPPDRAELRARLIDEEAAEFGAAAARQNWYEMIDALVDLLYVTYGAAVEMGVDLEPFFEEVHQANLRKTPAADSGKSIKPEHWLPPDIAGVYERWMRTRAPVLRKVDCIRIPVPDLVAGLAFYRDQLGHPLAWRREREAGLRLPEMDTEIVLYIDDAGVEVDFLVLSADEAAREVERIGGSVVMPPIDIQIGRCAVVADPFGNRLVLLDMSRGPVVTDAAGNVVEHSTATDEAGSTTSA